LRVDHVRGHDRHRGRHFPAHAALNRFMSFNL
jgi:hypothetical protein